MGQKLLVMPFIGDMNCVAAYINDPRGKDQGSNVKLSLGCDEHGWPYLCVENTAEIRPHQEVLMDYGPDHFSASTEALASLDNKLRNFKAAVKGALHEHRGCAAVPVALNKAESKPVIELTGFQIHNAADGENLTEVLHGFLNSHKGQISRQANSRKGNPSLGSWEVWPGNVNKKSTAQVRMMQFLNGTSDPGTLAVANRLQLCPDRAMHILENPEMAPAVKQMQRALEREYPELPKHSRCISAQITEMSCDAVLDKHIDSPAAGETIISYTDTDITVELSNKSGMLFKAQP